MARRFLTLALGLGVTAVLAGCVAYRPESLPTKPNLKASVAGLTLPAGRWVPLPGMTPHRIDPRVGLDPTAIAILAVLNDPALQAVRAQRGVAAAQLFAAGLLPDPVLSLGRRRPVGGGSTVQSGSSLGLGGALVPLVTRGDRMRAARAHVREVDLGLLWKGWQVAQRARWLAAEIAAERQLHKAEMSAWKLVGGWRTVLRHSGAEGDASAAELVQAQALVTGLVSDIGTTERKLNNVGQNLRALLGLSPQAGLTLRSAAAPDISTAAVRRALKNLPNRRPDLLALAAGFRSKDQSLRAAIAAQFPAITVNFLRESDVEGVTSLGFGLSLQLPFFNGNRGAIRKAEASRVALKAHYQARLDQAMSEVARLERDHGVLRREVTRLQTRQEALSRYGSRLQRLVFTGAASRLEALRLVIQLYRVRQQEIEAQLALRKTAIALETVLGVPPEWLNRSQKVSRS